MNVRFCSIVVPLLFGLFLVVVPVRSQDKEKDKEKNSIKSLFDGIPADLRAKVRDNPVRCDRVNDWLKENVNGKEKTIEIRLGVTDVQTSRFKDGTYLVRLSLTAAKGSVLEDEWRVIFGDQPGTDSALGRSRYNFSFTGVSTTEAEKLVDLKQVVIQGKVQEARLGRNGASDMGGVRNDGLITIALEDVRVDGQKWTPYVSPVAKKKGATYLNSQIKVKGRRRHD